MSAYRYIVFPKGRQPTVHEVEEMEAYAPLLEKRFAYGINKQDGGLAIAFDATSFERAIERDMGFETLIRRWEKRGCELVDHLSFVKDRAALKPVVSRAIHQAVGQHSTLAAATGEKHLTAKELAAREALGRSGLEVHSTLRKQSNLIRWAAWVPYLLMGLGGVLTITAGFVIGNRMLNSESERRKETIERVASDAMKESIQRQRRVAAKEATDEVPLEASPAETKETLTAEDRVESEAAEAETDTGVLPE